MTENETHKGEKSTMLVSTKDVAKRIQAVKQPGQKAVALSVKKGQLLLRGGFELDSFSLTWQQAIAEKPADIDEVLLEHKILAGITRAAPDELNMDLSEEGIHLWTDNTYWKLPALDALNEKGDQPQKALPVSGKIKLGFEFPIARFREIVKLLATTASDDRTRPILTTTLIAHNGEQLVACVTDTYRLRVLPIGEYCVKCGIDPLLLLGKWTQVETLPIVALQAVAKAITKFPRSCSEPVRLQLRAKAWTVSCGSVRLVAGYGSDQYPKVAKVIPSDKTVWALTLDTEEFRQVLKSLAPVAALDSNRVVLDWQSGENIILKADDHYSEAEVAIPSNVKSKQEEWHTAFNYEYLLDGLEGREGDITLTQSRPLDPILLDFAADGLYVLMPMQTL